MMLCTQNILTLLFAMSETHKAPIQSTASYTYYKAHPLWKEKCPSSLDIAIPQEITKQFHFMKVDVL